MNKLLKHKLLLLVVALGWMGGLAFLKAQSQTTMQQMLLGANIPAVVAPTVRGSGFYSSTSANTVVLTWPVGTIAGDLAVIGIGTAYSSTPPAGWTIPSGGTNYSASTWNGYGATKVLDASDIMTGSVTVTLSGGPDHVQGQIVTFVGGTGGVREIVDLRLSSSLAAQTLTTSGAVQNTDTGIYFNSCRGGAVNTVTMSRGVVLQTSSPTGGVSMSSTNGEVMPGGATGVLFDCTGTAPASNGQLRFIMVIKP